MVSYHSHAACPRPPRTFISGTHGKRLWPMRSIIFPTPVTQALPGIFLGGIGSPILTTSTLFEPMSFFGGEDSGDWEIECRLSCAILTITAYLSNWLQTVERKLRVMCQDSCRRRGKSSRQRLDQSGRFHRVISFMNKTQI